MWFKILIAVSFLMVICFIYIQLASIPVDSIEKASKGQSFTDKDRFLNLDGTPFNETHDLTVGLPRVYMYFDPSCSACVSMVKMILKNYIEFEMIDFVLVSESSMEELIIFSNSHSLGDYTNIIVVQDSMRKFANQFGLIETPSFVIYDSSMVLVKILDQYVTFSIVVRYVREAVNSSCQTSL